MLSIVVTWRNRKELARALPSIYRAAREADGDVAIVNFGGSPQDLATHIRSAGIPAVDVIEVPDQKYFNKARAQNVGAVNTSGRVLFFCDCDIVLEPRGVAELAARVADSANLFGTLAGVRESDLNSRRAGNVACFGYHLMIRLANGRSLQIVDQEEDAQSGARHAPGLLMVRREHFESIDGYNGRLHGWGWEDQDMIARLTLGAGLQRIQAGIATHISHDDEARMAYYPPAANRWESRDRMFRQALHYYDMGDFRGTASSDAAVPHRFQPASCSTTDSQFGTVRQPSRADEG